MTGQFSSVQYGIYALGKAHMRSTPSLSFPNVAFETIPMFISPAMALSRPFIKFRGRSSGASSFHACLFQAVDGVMSFDLCPQVKPQAAQHFRFCETQAICDGCFACQCICSVVSFHSGMSRAVHPQLQEFSKLDQCQPSTHSSLGYPFHLSALFVASSCNL